MAKAKPTKVPPAKSGRSSSGKKKGKGSSMFKWLLVLALVGGFGYVAFTVPVSGKTLVTHAMDASPWTLEIKRKQAATRVGNGAPSETITAAEREALDRLVSR